MNKKTNAKKMLTKIKKSKSLYIMFAPVLVYYAIFHYWPMYGVQIAFRNYMPALGISSSPWIGLDHFDRFFNSYYFWRFIRNTLGISIYSIIIGTPAPIILAIMFNELKNRRFRKITQTVMYAPHFLSTVVVAGIVLFFLSPTGGVINALRENFGFEAINYIAEKENFWHIYVWSGIWQNVGWGTIIFTSSISGIPIEQYEAAIIDGCSRIKRIWYITLPNILPTIVIITILNFGRIMSIGFEKIFLLQNDMNLETSEVISTFVYRSGILGAQFSFAAAIGVFNNVINFILLIAVNKVSKKITETSLW